ncbi:MAG: hypothetical protein LBV30_00760 [Propionibacteriaceae bacterium]|jgi:hypothetical protein|nr:hypothetical protein [Propionibacteriaceae bacterium]
MSSHPRHANKAVSIASAIALSAAAVGALGVSQFWTAPLGAADALSADQIVTAAAPSTVPAGAQSYVIGEQVDEATLPEGTTLAVPGMLTTVDELLKYSSVLTIPENPSSETLLVSSVPKDRTVLAGDSVSLEYAIWAAQSQGAMIPGNDGVYTGENYLPKFNAIGISLPGNAQLTPQIKAMTTWPTDCAPGAPRLESFDQSSIWDAWCLSPDQPGVIQVDFKDLQATENILLVGVYPFSKKALGLSDSDWTGAGSGPNNAFPGGTSTNSGIITVIDPSIEVVKEVCAVYEQGEPQCQAISDEDAIMDGSANDGDWVDDYTLPLGAKSVMWRITVTNTGNVDLKDVHVANEDWGFAASADADKADMTSCANLGSFADLAAGDSDVQTCTTPLTDDLEGVLRNGVNVNASLDGEFNSPNNAPLDDRLSGNPEGDSDAPTPGVVGSNTDIAQVSSPNPGLKLTKWVCSTGSDCAVPAADSAEFAQLAGYSAAEGVFEGTAVGDWVKQAELPYASDVQWLIIATNTGNTHLGDVSLPVEDQAGSMGSNHSLTTMPGYGDPADLLPGASVVWQFKSPQLTDTGAFGAGTTGATLDPETMEAPYALADAASNTAQAKATPVDDEGEEYPGVTPIDSNPSSAEARTDVNPAIKLTKWVCSTGTDCPVPTGDDLVTIGGNATTPGAPVLGWVKETTVEYGSTVSWLMVVTNIGDTPLMDVKIPEGMDQLTGGGFGESTGITLASGQSSEEGSVGDAPPIVAFLMQTSDITNEGAYDEAKGTTPDPIYGEVDYATGSDVVNTAQATGLPVDDNGDPLPLPDSADAAKDKPADYWTEPIKTNQSNAEVRTDKPQPDIDIIKYDTTAGENDQVVGNHDGDDIKDLAVDQTTPLEFTITNNGTEDLVDVVVTDELMQGTVALTEWTCDFSALGGPAAAREWAGPFLIGDSFTCKGTLAALPAGERHQDVAKVTARGALTDEPVNDENDWNAKVPPAVVVVSTGGTAVQATSIAPWAVGLLLLAGGVSVALVVTRRRHG